MLELKVKGTPISVSHIEFTGNDGKPVVLDKCIVEINGTLYPINSQNAEFVKLCKENQYKEVQLNLTLAVVGNFVKLRA